MSAPLLIGTVSGIFISSIRGNMTAALYLLALSFAFVCLARKSRPRHDFRNIVICSLLVLAGAAAGVCAVSALDLRAGRSVASLSGENSSISGKIAWIYESAAGRKYAIGSLKLASGRKLSGRLLVDGRQVPRWGEDAHPGDLVDLEAKVRLINGPMNPGAFDSRGYWFIKGVVAQADVVKEAMRRSEADVFSKAAWRLTQSFKSLTEKGLKANEKALMDAIVLSDRSSLDESTADDFANGGISHVMSASGLHLSVVMGAIAWSARRLGVGRAAAVAITAVTLPVYVIAAGSRASIIRAALMGAIALAASLASCRRPSLVLSACFAAFLQLISSPMLLFDKGALMSYLAMGGLALSGAMAKRLLPDIRQDVAREGSRGEILSLGMKKLAYDFRARAFSYTKASLLTSVMVTAVVLPVSATFYGRMSLLAPLANLFALPAASLALVIGLAAFCIWMIWPWAGAMAVSAGGPLLRMLAAVASVSGSERFPSAATGGKPDVVLIAAYYAAILSAAFSLAGTISLRKATKLLVTALCKTRERRAVIASLLLVIFLLSVTGQTRKKTDESICVLFMSVGQGDCALITSSEGPRRFVMLVDTGPSYKGGSAAEDTLLPVLAYMGIRKIDVLMLTHGHMDHISGLAKLKEEIGISTTIVPAGDAACLAQATEAGFAPLECIIGTEINAPGLKVGLLNPETVTNPEDDLNEQSIVLMLESGGSSLLLAADTGAKFEGGYLKGPVEVLKVGHHGSSRSSTESFLERVRPLFAVISVGKNMYGHPAPDAIGRLMSSGANVLRTDVHGAVTVKVQAGDLKVSAQSSSWDLRPFFRALD